jgi:hypothetical protein
VPEHTNGGTFTTKEQLKDLTWKESRYHGSTHGEEYFNGDTTQKAPIANLLKPECSFMVSNYVHFVKSVGCPDLLYQESLLQLSEHSL